MADEKEQDVCNLNKWFLNLQLHMKYKNYKAAWNDVLEMLHYLKRINRPDIYAKEENA